MERRGGSTEGENYSSAAAGDQTGCNSNSNSYMHIQDTLSKQFAKRADELHKDCIAYVVDWEKCVTARASLKTKETERLRLDADHYKAKVSSLEAAVSSRENKGKPVPPKEREKLERNEEKLEEAERAYDVAANDLFLFLDEVVDRSWRDLQVLAVRVLRWEASAATDEASALQGLEDLVRSLQRLGDEEGISHRLCDISNMSPEALTTRRDGGKPADLPCCDDVGPANDDDDDNKNSGKEELEEPLPEQAPQLRTRSDFAVPPSHGNEGTGGDFDDPGDCDDCDKCDNCDVNDNSNDDKEDEEEKEE